MRGGERVEDGTWLAWFAMLQALQAAQSGAGTGELNAWALVFLLGDLVGMIAVVIGAVTDRERVIYWGLGLMLASFGLVILAAVIQILL